MAIGNRMADPHHFASIGKALPEVVCQRGLTGQNAPSVQGSRGVRSHDSVFLDSILRSGNPDNRRHLATHLAWRY